MRARPPCSADGTILFANEALAGLVRMPLGSLVGRNLVPLVAPADHALLAEFLAARGGIGEAALVLSATADPDDGVPVRVYAREVRTSTGEPTLCLLVVDQTERLEAERRGRPPSSPSWPGRRATAACSWPSSPRNSPA